MASQLPTVERIVQRLRARAVLLPPSISYHFVAEQILQDLRDAVPKPEEALEISCWEIDEFRPYQDVKTDGVTLPLLLPERTIKEGLNSLLRENKSAGDWGGEDDDIFASCTVSGSERPIAMMLKGPSVPHPMRLKDGGKNGDQVLRVTEAPAEVFVVQHVNKITEPVRRQLRLNVEALRSRGVDACCAFIDGLQTYKLLSHLITSAK
jgi:hypothetical protein